MINIKKVQFDDEIYRYTISNDVAEVIFACKDEDYEFYYKKAIDKLNENYEKSK